MSHARQQIRDAVVTLLNTSPTSYRRAYNTRIPPMQQVWPYVLVWCDTETVEEATVHPSPIQDREATLTIEARLQLPLRETQNLETDIDTVAAEIETKLTSGAVRATLARVHGVSLSGTTMEIVVDQDDAPSFATVRLSYRMMYATVEGSPESLI